MKALISLFIFATFALSLSLEGSGATSANSAIKALSKAYFEQFGLKINYTAIGSSGGIKQVRRDEVDFALTEIKKDKPDETFQEIPILDGNIVLVYNLAGVSNLELTPDVIAGIYLGKIIYWDDKRIVNLNKNANLPHDKITPVHRYDGSGATLFFSSFLSLYNPEWKSEIGASRAPEWTAGVGRRGNSGIAKEVKESERSLGYVEYSYAKENDLKIASILIDGEIYQLNSPKYPLKIRTYFFFKRDGKNAKDVRRFIDFIYKNGDALIKNAGLEPLKESDKERISIN